MNKGRERLQTQKQLGQHNLQLLQQVAEQDAERQTATQQAALAAEPLYHDPPQAYWYSGCIAGTK